MKDKEISIGVCGAIVGVLIGAGSITYSQDVSGSLMGSLLTAKVPAGYQNTEFYDAYRRRSVSEAERERQAEQMAENKHRAAPRELTREEKEECRTRVRITEELRADVLPLLPDRPIDFLLRRTINHAFDASIEECMSVRDEVLQSMGAASSRAAESSSASSEAMQADVEQPAANVPSYKDCAVLSGARYTDCVGAARRGEPYEF